MSWSHPRVMPWNEGLCEEASGSVEISPMKNGDLDKGAFECRKCKTGWHGTAETTRARQAWFYILYAGI